MECCCGVVISDLSTDIKRKLSAILQTTIIILVHTEPLLKNLGLLKVGDRFKLTLLKFYYKLMNNELPSYFMTMSLKSQTISVVALRTGARPPIRTPRIHHVFAESTVLYINEAVETPFTCMNQI